MHRMFGTDGVRGIANKELTCELAYKLGKAGAFVLTEGTKSPKILVGMDTRISGDMLENALVSGILSVGAKAICVGVIPTPAIAYLTRKYKADAGVVISASHNPVEYNGIKFFNRQGYKLPDQLEDKIQSVIESEFSGIEMPIGGEIGRKTIKSHKALTDYIEFAKSTVDIDLTGLKVALDCANGASSVTSVKAFKELGADVYVINNDPDGVNINKNCGSTHCEELMEYVVNKKCDIGFAFDGDADRCLAVDERGNLISGDFIIAVIGKYLRDKGKLNKDSVVVTVMSNLGLDIALNKEEIKTVKTKVGDRYVLEEMKKSGYVLGGEQSGHIIMLDYNTTGDGLITAIQTAAIVKQRGKTLSQLASFVKELPQVLVNAKVPNDRKNIYTEDEEIMMEIKKMEEKLDGCGRVLIRPSGTEPLVRVMLEGKIQSEIDNMANDLAILIEEKANEKANC
ncbi:phosphoglucosamine mutase [Clostridium tyrobutyricum]|jgi:phosphoglucosamine mutase|uniref:Phosphoglucosamine mutase n=1 Tax=Clostridium tyrobutyricum DIVETGP TaxID=1408889 RepID=W6NED2_CLOTY|nr:phosphoglucosamine mutase [Clostridium tyrobutyricum]AND86076.1 phosphoglucosamine mutase [Clostridium tyrobutyricum]ANP70576.1 phosphoglucosamine mutase [Clostridium tyrobutyricum]MBV4416850.1 phosphoglucosamine mutase [Clostridium tyrobutyricum]MBV4428932.1 phosphoglucosamine mutase [Clostridium tyrobutyricum]MBV4434155.1 phosphoglucosamine mutase [Clostridium tyrobutyricum]